MMAHGPWQKCQARASPCQKLKDKKLKTKGKECQNWYALCNLLYFSKQLSVLWNIFQKTKVAKNNNAHISWYHFLTQFFSYSFTKCLHRSFWLDVEEFQPIEKLFLKLTLQTKWITPSERALVTMPKNGVRSCVPFHLRSLGPLERCVHKCHGQIRSWAC